MPVGLPGQRVSLIVSIDTHGNNLIAENKKLFAERRDPIVEEICEHVHYIK